MQFIIINIQTVCFFLFSLLIATKKICAQFTIINMDKLFLFLQRDKFEEAPNSMHPVTLSSEISSFVPSEVTQLIK